MNEFLEQFLVESRELVQQATEDLLALEASPQDKARVDSAFRGFHTLKGAAGIVDFPAMGQMLHAAEDVLEAVRSGRRPATGELVGDCLACLDQVVRWLDAIEADGEVPSTPDPAAEALAARFQDRPVPTTSQDATSEDATSGPPGWLEGLLSRCPAQSEHARAAFRYEPDSDCFFRGDDPLDLVSRVPDIVALDVRPRLPWPPLDDLDTFACNLVITALTAAIPDRVAAVLHAVSDQTLIWPLAEAPRDVGPALSPEALAVLREQRRLVSDATAEGFSGRLASAARVAINVLRQAGLSDQVATLEKALTDGLAQGNAAAFANALDAMSRPAEPVAKTDELVTPTAPATHQTGDPPPALAVRSLRVDVERIDGLVALTGELTVAKNAFGHAARLAQDGVDRESLAQMLKDQHALLDRLVSELQRSVLEIRVLPLRHVFQRFPRLVREMARDLGKSVRLVTEGESTEADKATVEALFEPLLHVLRNALDHGIELETERRAAGKDPDAALSLRARREGDFVIVEVADDGRGIDVENVRRAAARLGLAPAEALAELSDDAVAELLFAPGFSTAASVTNMSGRGVGMDAVRAAVARIGGSVAIASEPGLGTTVRFTLPFTVMVAQVMTVQAGGQVFGIPIESVIETVRIPRARISRLGAAEAFVLRERTVPMLPLSETLGLPSPGASLTEPNGAHARVVIVSVDGETAGIEVDDFGERMDVMLKPLEGLLAGMRGFAGTTLLGDGRVLIVLDPRALPRLQDRPR